MALMHERAERHTIQIRKGDNVKVLAGKDAGKSGRVLSINARKSTVVVEHVGIITRHTRPNPSKNIKGGIVEKEAAINVSNVMVICPSCGKHTRIGHTMLPDGTKMRSCRHCKTTLDKKRTRRKTAMKSRWQEKYRSETVPALMKRSG